MVFWAILFAVMAIGAIAAIIYQVVHKQNAVWPILMAIVFCSFSLACMNSYHNQQSATSSPAPSQHEAKSSDTDATDDEDSDTRDEEADASSDTDDTEASSSSSSATSSSSTTTSTPSASYSAPAASSSSSATSSSHYTPTGRGVTNNQRSGGGRNYAYKPVPQTGSSETVYVSASIPGRYHKDPNCRGLQRYGGVQTMTLSQAQAQGYRAFCAYERYGN
ncbi:hypothetical protein PQ472_10475 [Lacticaseibacillus pabuli]|uniref:Uncharacterized protein n=1 Tax=Lacticaseibacillus pabuli TaxID=3025672 RepID=A0ABY7WQ53_9LACO|nr:hypothetical protein [Lacticaseibacillus sp. KACC 23028]WDF82304.1 hypothetical protein PQ472_10475 [Lacticaseibacillus sp. KACC 23028]